MLEDVWQQTTVGKAGTSGGASGSGISMLSRIQMQRVVKNVESLKYYHYRLHRTDVEAMIRGNGDFILRKGTRNDPEGYTVSVRWGGRMLHFPIHWVNGQCCFESQSFSLVQNLIHHHHATGEPVTAKSGAVLKTARTRQVWELLEKDIEQSSKLGNGAFGCVYEGNWTRVDGLVVIVAIKTLDTVSTTAEGGKVLEHARMEMLREARIMRELSGHPNVVREFGVTIDRELPYAIMELMSGGSLDRRLRLQTNPLSVKAKLKVCLEVARGLSYINRSGYIHRDVAARNCLFEALPNKEVGVVKLTDFGLAQKLDESGSFKGAPDEKIPIVWTAFEGLTDGWWFLKSDVWSMGVVIWEIFSDGCKPFCDLEVLDKESVSRHLREGNRLKAYPAMNMPAEVERLMDCCMFTNEALRPPITYVCWKLQEELCALLK